MWRSIGCSGRWRTRRVATSSGARSVGEASVSALAADCDMSFAAVQKHVAVLEGAGLVTKHHRGRERLVRGNPDQIARARELLFSLEGLWRTCLGQLDAVLADPTSDD